MLNPLIDIESKSSEQIKNEDTNKQKTYISYDSIWCTYFDCTCCFMLCYD